MSQVLFSQSRNTLSFSETRENSLASSLTAYERTAYQFCHDWLTGREVFTLQTSGSTGAPKSVTLHRRHMAASAALTGQALQLEPGDTALVNLHVQYIAGIMMLVRGLELGLHLTVQEPSARPLEHWTPGVAFNFQSYVPLQLQNILEKTPEKIAVLNTAKAILVGGAPVSAMLEDQLQAVRAPVYQTYGMTETVSHIALRRLNGPEKQFFYTALDTISLEADARGCLVIHAPALTEQPVVTNDVVELLSTSTFRWLGRADHVINSGGIKVQAEKVEQAVEKVLATAGILRRFFVAGLPHPVLGETVTLILEGEPLSAVTENSILQNLKAVLTTYEVPRQIRYISRFSETPTAKIDRKNTLQTLLKAQ